MASVATSNITQVDFNQSKISISGFAVEVWRIASGQAVGDTAVITPAREKLIKAVFGPVTHNVPASGASSVTVTLAAVTGSAITVTISTIDVFLICAPR
jgi:hypothetical protein